MSEYMVCKGQFEDLDALKEALVECGVATNRIEVHNDPVVLHGYHKRENGAKAEVVIRAGATNSYDVGFAKKDGVYVPVVNDMDVRFGIGQHVSNGTLLQTYCKNRILREVQKRRCRVIENRVTEDGKIRIVLSS